MPRPVDVVVAALEARGCNPRGNPEKQVEALCPAHDDRNPSLGVKEGFEGTALVYCQAGCNIDDVLGALGLTVQDLFVKEPEPLPVKVKRTVVAEYTYTDAEGQPLYQVVRYEPKTFRQRRWTGSGWEWSMDGVERTLFHLPDVLKAKAEGRWIFVTEGEKDALAVEATGQCGTTMPGGVGKWKPQYTEILTGAKVVILADDDEPGKKHAVTVKNELFGKAQQVGIRLPAQGHEDIAAHLAAGLSLNGDLRKAPDLDGSLPVPMTGRAALTARAFASTEARGTKDWVVGPMFQRGMRTVIGAATGEGKTTFSMEVVKALLEGGRLLGEEKWVGIGGSSRALIVDLEQGEETVKTRLREAGLHLSDRVDVLWEPNGIALDKREEDRAMLRDILREGLYDLVLLDPLYQTHLGSGNDEAVAAATMRVVDSWAREFNCSLVIPMHARKPHPEAGKNFTQHDIAGVGTWLRNAEFILGLQLISSGLSRLWTFKDRMGQGPEIRSNWWLDFDRETGFRRNYKEQKDAVKRAMKHLLARDEGASREELAAVEGGNEVLAQEVIKSVGRYQRGDRYRSKKWPDGYVSAEQTSIDL